MRMKFRNKSTGEITESIDFVLDTYTLDEIIGGAE